MELNAIEAKVWKTGGGSYVITIPKSLVDSGVIQMGKALKCKFIIDLHDGDVVYPGYTSVDRVLEYPAGFLEKPAPFLA